MYRPPPVSRIKPVLGQVMMWRVAVSDDTRIRERVTVETNAIERPPNGKVLMWWLHLLFLLQAARAHLLFSPSVATIAYAGFGFQCVRRKCSSSMGKENKEKHHNKGLNSGPHRPRLRTVEFLALSVAGAVGVLLSKHLGRAVAHEHDSKVLAKTR
jgi:hypothetical protein